MPSDGIGSQMRVANEFLDLRRPTAIVVPTWIPTAAMVLGGLCFGLGKLMGVM